MQREIPIIFFCLVGGQRSHFRDSHYHLDMIAMELEALYTGHVYILYPTHPLRVAYPSFLYVPSMVYTVSAVYIFSLLHGHYPWGLTLISWSHLCPSPSLAQQPGVSWKPSHGHGILMPKVLRDFLPCERLRFELQK